MDTVQRWKVQELHRQRYLNKVPFVILRAISDKADDSATMDYPTFEKQAIENSVKLIKELVGQI